MKKYSQLIKHSGNEALFEILDVSVSGTLIGAPIHIHAEGLRGTGKTTVIRAYKEVLPKISRIKGCLYNCDPEHPHCPLHRHLNQEDIKKLGVELIDMPFLEISPSAKKSTVVGSIDLKKLTSKKAPEAALLLGTIPKAHRGIIFIDEINRIADTSPEIADVLLDVMGTKPGRIQIEEVGFPVVEIPIEVSVWAASNPDEDPGSLEEVRRQLSDRFDFSVNVERPLNADIIKSILDDEMMVLQDVNPIEKRGMFSMVEKIPEKYHMSDHLKELLANMYVDFGLESLRGIEAILTGSQIRGKLLRRSPNYDDIIFTARYALRHRVDGKTLNDILSRIEQRKGQPEYTKVDDTICAGSKAITPAKEQISTAESAKSTFLNSVQRLISRFKRRGQDKVSRKANNAAGVDPKDINIKAPPHKALAIKELEPREYVKTEEELL